MVDSIGGAKTQYRYAAPGRYTGQPSLVNQPRLCDECNKNQATKIQELNSFEPSREYDFQSELDTHKQQLDERYKLCHSCHEIVEHHLNVQAMDLKTFLLGTHLQQSKSTPTKLLKRSSSPESIFVVLAQLTCVFLATLLVCSDSTLANHNTCGKALSSWNISLLVDQEFWSSFPSTNMTTASKYLVFHLTQLFQVAVRSSWEKSSELMLCLCSLAKRKYLHISLGCLLINILIFLKRKTRFGIFILVSWILLSALRFWEVFWLKADTRWHVTVAVVCCILGVCSFLFSLLSYSRVLGTRKKKRCQFTPSPPSVEKHYASHSYAMETSTHTETTPSHNKTSTELDHNLNGLTLGLPAETRNGYKTPLSSGNSGRTGFFWSQSLSNSLKETPLVSMHQRPLIVPATLQFSGLRKRSPASRTQETTRVARYAGSSCSFSSDEDSGSVPDAMNDDSVQKSRIVNDKQSKPERVPKKTKRQTSSQSSTTKLIIYPKPRTLLLFASLVFNAYFIVSFTDWPLRLLYSLWKIFKK